MDFEPPEMPKIPPALQQAAVLLGGDLFERQEFLACRDLGTITDFLDQTASDGRLGIAGANGAAWVSPSGTILSSVRFESPSTFAQFLDMNGQGDWKFLDRGGLGWQSGTLVDSDGSHIWTCPHGQGVDDMAAGDVNGDGIVEFVVGYNGKGGIRLLDNNGKTLWRQPDGNVWHIELIDVNDDQVPEIVHSNGRGELIVRDRTGELVSRVNPDVPLAHFSLCHWPTRNSPLHLLTRHEGSIYLLDLGGKTVADFEAPHCGEMSLAWGTPVRFASQTSEHLAVLANFMIWNRSVLLIYDSARELVFQEILEESGMSLTAIPDPGGNGERLLVGGDGHVWEYVPCN